MQQRSQDKVVALTSGKGALGAVQRGQLISRLREQLRDAFMQRIRVMFENADDAFFSRADKAENNQQQAIYFEAMRAVRLQRKRLESDFVATVLKSFEHSLMPGVKYNPQPNDLKENELSLVETDELEERLAIDGMASKAKRLYAEELYLIGQRLAALSSQTPPSTDDEVTIGPRIICAAFSEAAVVLDIPIQPKLVLYKLFDRYVVGDLGDVYAGCNLTLREAGVLPDLRGEGFGDNRSRHQSPRRRGSTSRVTEGYEADDNDELAVALQAFLGSVRAQGGAYSGHVAAPPVVSGRELVGALSRLQQQVNTADAAAPFAASMIKDELRHVVGGSGVAAQAFAPVDESTIDIVATLFDFIFDAPSLPEPFKGLIARLQIPMLKVALLDRSFLASKHHPARRLLNLIARAGIGWTPDQGGASDALLARIQEQVNRVIDEFEDDAQVFEKVLEDLEAELDSEERLAQQRESTEAEQSLRRETREIGRAVATAAIDQVLVGGQIPMEVENFLRGPWRDLLASIYVSSGSESKPWMTVLNIASMLVWSLMPKHTDEARAQMLDTLPIILRALRDGMEKLNLPEDQRDALLARLACEHSKLARAPRPVGQDADALEDLASEDLASVLSDEPEMSTESEPSSVDHDFDEPEDRAEEPAEPTAEAESAPATEVSDRKSFMARKTDEINRMIAEGRFRGAETVTPSLGDATTPGIDDEFMGRAESLTEGTWLDWTDANGHEQRIKLSWRSIISGKYFFVNRQGVKVVEMTPEALAGELRASRAQIIEDAPVVDRALLSALDSLQENRPAS